MNNRFADGEVLIDRYRITRFHAAGGMQEVYLSYDLALNRNVALKTPKNGVVDRRFRRGAEMGARVNHPNVAATFDYFENDALTFMVEEFIEGSDLGSRMEREFVFLDPSLAAHVIHHVARALFEAHRANICHRDLKPSNIMTSDDPALRTIKLTDFGIAKLAQRELEAEMARFDKDNSTLTSSHTLLGAVPYMAPECWADWRSSGQPMDIWALGCIGYQLLCGVPPFGTGRSAIRNVLKAEVNGVELKAPPWYGRNASSKQLELDLWQIIVECIQVDPASRPTAERIISACNALCYADSNRRTGVIETFGVAYATGGKSNSGNIRDSESNSRWFFHGSDFFGTVSPAVGQRVSFSMHPGVPNPRCSPVLLLR